MMAEQATEIGPALLLPVVMAASFSGYVVMTRQLEGELLQTNLFYTALGVFVVLTPIVPWSWVTPPTQDIAELVGIGAVGLLALWALDRAVACASVSKSMPALYLHMPALVLVGWMMEGDVPSPRKTLGGLVIGAAVAWVVWAESRQSRDVPARARA
jgi:drug/metabolite transporter (DMT)-like permease